MLRRSSGLSLRSLGRRRAVRGRRGGVQIEYIVIVGAVVLAAIGGFSYFGTTVGAKVQSQGASPARMGL